MKKTSCSLYFFYFLIKFSLVSVSICWFFFHDWYRYTGKNFEGNDVYLSVGLLKLCIDTECHFNKGETTIFKALQILCYIYLFSIILENIIAIISLCCFQYMLPAMTLSINTCFFTEITNSYMFYPC
ncbi:hypothetical protein HZS_3193 [Henneguya salminicola]|nr:hypothetical protein HZS_3193 [Henneguya salminicola]